MKKVLAILLVLVMVFCFAACGGQEDEPVAVEYTYTELTEDMIDTCPWPVGYTYEVVSGGEVVDSGEYTYPEDISHSLLVGEHATMAERTIISSAIEDGMIYTDCDVTLQDDTKLEILYINDPETLNYVACTVSYQADDIDQTTNYQFVY